MIRRAAGFDLELPRCATTLYTVFHGVPFPRSFMSRSCLALPLALACRVRRVLRQNSAWSWRFCPTQEFWLSRSAGVRWLQMQHHLQNSTSTVCSCPNITITTPNAYNHHAKHRSKPPRQRCDLPKTNRIISHYTPHNSSRPLCLESEA